MKQDGRVGTKRSARNSLIIIPINTMRGITGYRRKRIERKWWKLISFMVHGILHTKSYCDVKDMIDKRKCAKQVVVAIIENGDDIFVGSNWCENPQTECPRKEMATGEGYDLCKNICKQRNHAEVDACIKAGDKAKGGTLYLVGHYYFCEHCIQTMQEYGLEDWHILKEMAELV